MCTFNTPCSFSGAPHSLFVSSKQKILRPMLPHPLFATALEYIFAKMMVIYNVQIGAWQRQFLLELFQVVLRMRGRVNFTNMARYSTFAEQTFRRHFQKAFRWVTLNLTILRLRRHPKEPLIGSRKLSHTRQGNDEAQAKGPPISYLGGEPHPRTDRRPFR